MANVKKLNPWLPRQTCPMRRGRGSMLRSGGPSMQMPTQLWYVSSRWPMMLRGQILNTQFFFGGSQVAISQSIFYPFCPSGGECWRLGCWIRTLPWWMLKRSFGAIRPNKGLIGMLQHPTRIVVIHTTGCCVVKYCFHCFPRWHYCSWRKHTESPKKQKSSSRTWLRVTRWQL